MALHSADPEAILRALATRGPLTAADLQHALGKSQPTVSRLLRDLGGEVVILGRGRATRYGRAASILSLPSRQPLWWTDEDGATMALGSLDHLADEWLHVALDSGHSAAVRGILPWFLSPLRVQGFLGRLRAQALIPQGFDHDPGRWSLIQQLHVIASQVNDPTGAITVGEIRDSVPTIVPAARARRARALEALALDVARTLPAGSSAAGEQAKFLAFIAEDDTAARGRHVLVKFAPPTGTPFGDRWHDLLHAEATALGVIAHHGIAAATVAVESTGQRTVLVAERFDRIGRRGRRHVVALDAVHAAFVPGPRQHWAATCEALARQRRLPDADAVLARRLLHFGRLIGNTDMHFGNLSVLVERNALAAGRFRIAPVYDMLPMRWRPDPGSGALDLQPFTPDPFDLRDEARTWAVDFWDAIARHAEISARFRGLARTMRQRLHAASG